MVFEKSESINAGLNSERRYARRSDQAIFVKLTT
jgi:hypothetical protein